MSLGQVVLIIAGVAVAALALRIGVTLLRSLGQSLPGPPPEGEMRRVTIRYRCSICGLEIRTVLAANQDPEPPRHCQEEMDLVTPIE